MIIYPVIQLQNGKCVSLHRGRVDAPEVWHVDPVEKARAFVAEGAEWLHVTDLDAVARTGSNAEIVVEIIRHCGVPVQVAGGIASDEALRFWFDVGAGRMVIGTTAVKYPDWVKAVAKHYPDQIAIAIDVYQGRVMTRGWTETSMFEPVEIVHAYSGEPLAAMIITDIDYQIGMPEASYAMITKLADETRTPIIAAGVVRSLDDISSLKYVGNVWGVLIGRALFNKDIDLAEAIATARAEPQKTAAFK